MEQLLKPSKFDVEHTIPTAAREWKHWHRTFQNFITAVEKRKKEGETIDHLEILTNFVAPNIYAYIEDCKDYDGAITTLTNLYIKQPNEIFARHQLATRKQQVGESLDDYLQALRVLSKDCQFKPVTAEVYTSESIRDAFISGLNSQLIRTRLLENATLSLDQAFQLARSQELAQKHSETYRILPSSLNVAASVDVHSDPGNQKPEAVIASGHRRQQRSSGTYNNYRNQKKSCYYCGKDWHTNLSDCPARDHTCKKCQKRGHFEHVCRSGSAPSASAMVLEGSSTPVTPTLYAISSCHPKVIVTASINRIPAKALADTGANITCISKKFTDAHKLEVFLAKQEVKLAAEHTAKIIGYIVADIKFKGHVYHSVKISVLSDLIEDVVIGTDLMEQHETVTLKFGGSRSPLVLSSLNVPAPSLFANLTSDVTPIATKSRRYSSADKEFISQQVEKLLAAGIIEPSNSPWRAQLLIDRSPNHKTRMVVDYAETINRFTELDAYPLPLIEDVVAEMAKYSVFTALDLEHAFHQVVLKEEDKPYTAFQAGKGLYQFTRVPFGLRNSGAVFQRIMDTMIQENNLKGAVFYVDNAYVGGSDQKEHDQNLEKFLAAAEKLNITFNVSKTEYCTDNMSILGHHLANGLIRPDPERVKPLIDLPPPASIIEQRRVLGMFAYYSRWIEKYSEHIQPLVKNTSFPLSEVALKAFDNLKSVLAQATLQPILEDVPFTVETDASNFAIAATLNQNGKPVAFHSRTLQGSELSHSAVEKEAYAIVEALRKWHHLLYGKRFTLVTDQRSVAFMFDTTHKSTIKNAKILRWKIELSALSYDIVYRPGKENSAPDTFSRVVSSLTTDSLKDIHESLCHPGVTRLYHYTRSKNLPYSTEEVKTVCGNCRDCAEIKPNFYKPPQGQLIKSIKPLDRLNIDFKGPLPSRSRNKFILTITDEYSRYPFAYPCSDVSAATVIKCLTHLFSIFGMPSFVHSDRGSSLISGELRTFLHSKGVATSNTTPYHPQGNGQVERYNGVIWNAILLALKSKGLPVSCWEDVLLDVLHSVRSLLCTATNCTPHERMFNHPRRTGLGVSLPSWLTTPGKVFLRNFVRQNKYEPKVQEVELLDANPNYARILYPSGRESTVSLKDLAPSGESKFSIVDSRPNLNNDVALEKSDQVIAAPVEQPSSELVEKPTPSLNNECNANESVIVEQREVVIPEPRRSERIVDLPKFKYPK